MESIICIPALCSRFQLCLISLNRNLYFKERTAFPWGKSRNVRVEKCRELTSQRAALDEKEFGFYQQKTERRERRITAEVSSVIPLLFALTKD